MKKNLNGSSLRKTSKNWGCVIFQARILITDPLHEDALSYLSKNRSISFNYAPQITRDELSNIIGQYNALIVRDRIKLTADLLDKSSSLKIIVRAGSGLDNIDLNKALSMGIKVVNIPHAIADSVAELTIGLMIILSRKLYKSIESVKKGEWVKNQIMGVELRGKKVGIIGVGNVGSRVAKLAHAFGMKPLLNDITSLDEEFVKRVDGEVVGFSELLSQSDYVTLHVPLTKQTERMIGERELILMKKTAYFINTARGKLIDHEALYKALTEGWIAGAALDVYEVEPPADLKLLRLENVICTPHIGAQTEEARRRASMEAVRIAIDYLSSTVCEGVE